MKNYKNRSFGDMISTVASMLLFLIFAGCLLMIISIAAGTYNRISNNFDKTFGSSASLRYISNKIKNSESTEIAEEGTAIYLKSGELMNIIYFENGALYEKSISADEAPSTGDGDKLFDLGNMKISDNGELLKITVTLNNEENSTYVRRR